MTEVDAPIRSAPVIVLGPDGLPRMRKSHRLVFDVALGRHRDGWRDVTDVELQAALERLHTPRRFDRAWIAGRVSEMKAFGLLLESTAHRLSRGDVSGVKVRATYIPRQWVAGGGGTFPVIASAGAAVASDSY